MLNNSSQLYQMSSPTDMVLTITIQWKNRSDSELLRVFVNNGSVDFQSFQVDIDDNGNTNILSGSAKVTSS